MFLQEYVEEIDGFVSFAIETLAQKASNKSGDGWPQLVLYANSTGALVALTYLRSAKVLARVAYLLARTGVHSGQCIHSLIQIRCLVRPG